MGRDESEAKDQEERWAEEEASGESASSGGGGSGLGCILLVFVIGLIAFLMWKGK